jgi:hypothetical protein
MQKSLRQLPIEDDPSLLAELSQLIAEHLERCSHLQVRGSDNFCTLEIRFADNSDTATDAGLVLGEFLQQTLRNTDFVLKTDCQTWLTVLHCLPADLPRLIERLRTAWHHHAETYPLRHTPKLSFKSGISFEPTIGPSELLAALRQYYHSRRKSDPAFN